MTESNISSMRVSDSNLRDYSDLLAYSRTHKSTDPIANRYPWQCRTATYQLVKFALDEQLQRQEVDPENPLTIRIRTDSFPDKIYGSEVADALVDFKHAGGRIRILVTNGPIHSASSSFSRFSGCCPEKFQIRHESHEEVGFRNHFLVVGEMAYRYEAEHKQFDGREFCRDNDFSPEIPARICFNHPKSALSLKEVFDIIWAMSSSSGASTPSKQATV